MATPADQTPATSSASESPTTQQARLRRDRREAKIKAGGSARLDKISQLSGRAAEAPPSLASVFAPSGLGPVDDPAEVDISLLSYGGARLGGGAGAGGAGAGVRYDGYGDGDAARAAEMRHMLRGGGGGLGGEGGVRDGRFAATGGFPPGMMGSGMGPGDGPGGEDPMTRMLRQMMGGEQGGDGDGAGALPPGLADLLAGAGVGVGGTAAAQKAEAKAEATADWWKVVHAAFALALGMYVTSSTGFSGSRVGRAAVGEDARIGVRFFWLFATAELLLQSTRFFVERGVGAGRAGGVLGMVMGVLPEPWKGYVALARRYGGIWTTVVEDAMVVVFVLGLKAWWKGGAVG